MNTLRCVAATVLVSSLAVPTMARATTINYFSVGNFTGTTFSQGGLTASAENGGVLGILSGFGLGVGGDAIINTDEHESVLFSFDSGGATQVSFHDTLGISFGGQLMSLEAFDLSGLSLGIHTFSVITAVLSSIDVSGSFGNVALSAFRIAGGDPGTGATVQSVSFNDAPMVPEPTTLLLCATGLLVGYWKHRAARLP